MDSFAYLLNAVVNVDLSPITVCEVKHSKEIRFKYAGETYVVRLLDGIAYMEKTEGNRCLTSAPKPIIEAIRLSHYKELAKGVPDDGQHNRTS